MKWYEAAFFIVVGLFALFAIFMLGYDIADSIHADDYRRGQIDALTDKIYYELIENEDMTRTWELIDD